MARIRSLKPQFWTSEQIAECSPNARLLFIGMWNFCDDYGVHPASCARLKMEVFPADAFNSDDVRRMVAELTSNGLVVEYEIDGKPYWWVTGWDAHQKPDTKTGLYPRPDGMIGAKIRRSFADHSPNKQRTVADHSPTEKEKEKEKEKKKQEEPKPDAAKAARFDPLSLDLGEVPSDKWAEWVAYRKSRKLSSAEATMRAQVDNLNVWFQKGHSPADVISKSIANGWQGLFEPKDSGAGPPRSQFMSHADQSKLAAARAIFGTEIEGNYGNGNIIDVSPATRSVGSKDISGTSGQLRFSVSESVEDGPDT